MRPGSAVRLTVAGRSPTRRKLVSVPRIAGQSVTRARALLRRAGLTASVSTRPSSRVPRGAVISSDPGGGARVQRGSDVLLFVSVGSPKRVIVPRLVRDILGEAKASLASRGLTAVVRPRRARPLWVVTAQSPAPDTRVPARSRVILRARPPR